MVVLLSSIVFFSACTEKKTDDILIQEQIVLLQAAIEAHDYRQFMSIVDQDYYDMAYGSKNNDRQALQRILLALFLRYKDISVFVSNTQIRVMQTRADAQSQIVLTGGKGLIPDSARHYNVQSCWKKVSGDWLLSCLEWQ
jgi:hypothetical protein